MTVAPYLNFPGNTREVIDYYIAKLGGSLAGGGIMTFGQMNMGDGTEDKPDVRDMIAHAWMKIGNSDVYFSDAPPGMFDLIAGNNVWLLYMSEDKADVQAKWDALAADSRISMPIGPTQWTSLYGMLTDKFGINWQFSYSDPAFR